MVSTANALEDEPSPAGRTRSLTSGDVTRLTIFIILTQDAILLAAGSGPLSLLLLTTMEFGCFHLMRRFGNEDINAAIILSICLTHLIIASFIKIALLQSLDDNLILPTLTEYITLVYFLLLLVAFFAARRLPLLWSRPHPELSLKALEWLIIISTALMLVSMVGQRGAETNSSDVSNFWGVATRGFPMVAMVASVTRALRISNGQKFLDRWSVAILGFAVILGTASNSREGVLVPLLAALVVPLYWGYRFSIRTMALVAILGAFVSFVVSPAILLVRADRDFLSLTERISRTVETAGLIITLDPATLQATQQPLDYINYSIWGRYFGQPVPFSDRVGLIQTTDTLAAAAYGGNYVMIEGSLSDQIAALFPNFVLEWFDVHLERTKAATDFVAGSLGLADTNAKSYLAIPADAEAYATGGMWSVITTTFFIYLLVFYLNRLFIGKVSSLGVLPISILLFSHHTCSEAGSGTILYFALRVLPQFVISFYFVQWIARILGSLPTDTTGVPQTPI
jgi:hypothetical protein